MKLIAYFLVVALLIWAAANFMGQTLGITLSGQEPYVSALIFAVILALFNMILGGILRLITFPINFLTLGLVSFLITLLMIYLADKTLDQVTISGFLGYIVIAIIPAFANTIVGKKK